MQPRRKSSRSRLPNRHTRGLTKMENEETMGKLSGTGVEGSLHGGGRGFEPPQLHCCFSCALRLGLQVR